MTPEPKIDLLTRSSFLFLTLWPTGLGLIWTTFGIGSPFALHAAVGISSVLFLVAALISARQPIQDIFARWQICALLVLVVVYAFGVIFPTHTMFAALFRAGVDLTIAVGAFCFVLLLRAGGEKAIRFALLCLLSSMLLYLAFFILNAGTLIKLVDGNGTLAFFPFINVRRLTNILAPISMIALGLWATGDAKTALGRYALLGSWIALATALIWSGGRAPVLAITGAVLVIAFLGAPQFRARLLSGAVLGGAVGSAVSMWLPQLPGSFSFWKRISSTLDAQSADAASSFRLTIWRETIDLFWQRPLLGHGPNQWMFHKPEFVYHGSTHNFPLQVLHDFGAIGGTAAMVLVLGTLIWHLCRLRNATALHHVAILMLVVMVLQSFLDAIFFGVASLPLALLAFALAHGTRRD